MRKGSVCLIGLFSPKGIETATKFAEVEEWGVEEET